MTVYFRPRRAEAPIRCTGILDQFPFSAPRAGSPRQSDTGARSGFLPNGAA